MKIFVISSTAFDTLKEAKAQLKQWDEEGHLDKNAKIYKSDTIYIPNIVLNKQKID